MSFEKIERFGDFERVFTSKANGIHPVSKYRSISTGLEVVHAEIEGPTVSGYIVLATKASDDSGLPHTLEHMIFMGSEDYPYKGVLDILANKCLASGTNAWTDCDHTCYELTTAGANGFCFLLPIYMDHVFHPLLTDEAFLMEVHHVNGEGKDAGVVYSELLAKENCPEDKTHTLLKKLVYEPKTGYHYNSGGIMKAVRETCTNEKVRKYHKEFYVPGNTRIIVCGTVDPEKLLASLAPVIEKLIAKAKPNKIPEWEKPWLMIMDPLKEGAVKTIHYAGEEDDECLVTVGMRGPSNFDETECLQAFRLVFEYLTDSAVGPVQLAFVESNDPLCSNVGYGEMENSTTCFYFEFENVPLEKVDLIVPRLRAVLEKQIASDFDQSRIDDIIRKHIQEEYSAMEIAPHNSIAYATIADFLFGCESDHNTFDKRICMTRIMSRYFDREKHHWTEIMLKKRILDQKWIVIKAIPSEKEHQAWIKSENHRSEQRVKTLGEPGLRKCEKLLEDAISFNLREIPSSLLDSLVTPSTKEINYHKIKRFQNPDFAKEFNCNLYIDHIKSNFLYISIHMDTTGLSNEQRKYLPLFKEALTESPIRMEDGMIKPFEEVVASLNRDLLKFGSNFGIDGSCSCYKTGSFNHIFSITAQIQYDKLEVGLEWLRRLLFHIQWCEERLKKIANKMATEINAMKRNGNKVAKALLKDVLYLDESNAKCTSFVRQQSFLKKTFASLPAEAMNIKKMMESIRLVLSDPKNITIHIATSIHKLNAKLKEMEMEPEAMLSKVFPTADSADICKKVANSPDSKWMQPLAKLRENPEQLILGVKGADSVYLCQAGPGLTDFNDPDFTLLSLAMQYFTQSEGPFFRAIRGGGFSYGYFMDSRPNEGLIYFHLTECSDVVAAYKVSQELILAHLNETEEWLDSLILAAKSSLCFEIIEGEKTPLALASSSLCSYYRNVPEGHARRMIERIETVTKKELQEMTKKYIAPIFSTTTACIVTCPSDKVKSIREGLNKLGKNLQVLPSLDKGNISKWSF